MYVSKTILSFSNASNEKFVYNQFHSNKVHIGRLWQHSGGKQSERFANLIPLLAFVIFDCECNHSSQYNAQHLVFLTVCLQS